MTAVILWFSAGSWTNGSNDSLIRIRDGYRLPVSGSVQIDQVGISGELRVFAPPPKRVADR